MKRVGRRLTSLQRDESIIRAVAKITMREKRVATLTSVSRELGIGASTYLLRKMLSMSIIGKLGMEVVTDKRGRRVYNFRSIASQNSECDLPWKCEGNNSICYNALTGTICTGAKSND